MSRFIRELIISVEFYKKSSNCLSAININNRDLRLKARPVLNLILKTENDGENMSLKNYPLIIFKTVGKGKITAFCSK